MKLSCCIVAAGLGTRLGDEWDGTPKALVPVLGRPMLYYSLNALDDFAGLKNEGAGVGIHQIVVASPRDYVKKFESLIKVWGFSRPVKVVPGGDSRSDSVNNCLKALESDPPDMVMIHDCARPCVDSDMIKLLVDAASNGHAATMAHKATDTLRLAMSNLIVDELERAVVACIETPQIFPFRKLYELSLKAESEESQPDESTCFTRNGEMVKVVYHDKSNLKVTYPEDIAAAEGILFSRGWQDVSEGED